MSNIKSLLFKSTTELINAGIESAGLDARVLLEAAIEKNHSYIITHPEMPITNADYTQFRRYIRRRKRGEPVAYILGHKEFFGLDFIVNKNVLIPRPESEWLVETALAHINNWQFQPKADRPVAQVVSSQQLADNEKLQTANHTLHTHTELPTTDCKPQTNITPPANHEPPTNTELNTGTKLNTNTKLHTTSHKQLNILDVGTGSGNIIISLVHELSKNRSFFPRSWENSTVFQSMVRFYGLDNSQKALGLARKNAKINRVNKIIKFFNSNLFSNPRLPKKFDLIIANLPYVPRSTSDQLSTIKFEPKEAIFADEDGAAIINKFLAEAKNRLLESGLILIELDPRNANKLFELAHSLYPQAQVDLVKDLASKDRYLVISV